jgi:NAD(P)-dependent dehydrogenase (short-subunit alcohol dehydrogenase family)
MQIAGSVALVTGSNRGLGRSLVDELLARGARKVYAASRAGTPHADARVVALTVDVTDPAQVKAAAAAAADVELLVNNAGVATSFSILQGDPAHLRRDLEVNVHGTLEVVRAFLPVLAAAKQAAIVNILSVTSMASMPLLGGYSASKAALWSLTQAMRAELRPKNIRVYAAFPGTIDTDMAKAFEVQKTSPEAVARAIFEGVAAGEENIAPDAMAAGIVETFVRDPRALEAMFAGFGS